MSASTLFLFSQQANTLPPEQEEQTAKSATAAPYDRSYTDVRKVSPELAAAQPRIHGRPVTCEEMKEFNQSQKTPLTQQVEIFLVCATPLSGYEFFDNLRGIIAKEFPHPLVDASCLKDMRMKELDKKLDEMVVLATQSERNALEAAKSAAKEECTPYRKQIADLDKMKSDWISKHRAFANAGVRVWEDIDESDYGYKWQTVAGEIEKIYATHTTIPRTELEAAEKTARREAELKQKPDRIELEKQALSASVSKELQSTVEVFKSEIAELIRPFQIIAATRTYASGAEYRSRLHAFLVQKQNEETSRYFASALSSEPLHHETVSKVVKDSLAEKLLRAIRQ